MRLHSYNIDLKKQSHSRAQKSSAGRDKKEGIEMFDYSLQKPVRKEDLIKMFRAIKYDY